ncbi:MAG: site-specific DNA-methyltransferase [Crocinitomicaceae bacterium]|nr:site-specific DNA-methyltransferase [Crocinitomicaceae bacterium]
MRTLQYKKENFTLFRGDSFKVLKKIDSDSIDSIITDPPYFLSNNGITCKGGKMVSVNKGNWDKNTGFIDVYNFNYNWIKESLRVLKDGGTLWVSGTYHNIYIIGSIINQISDFKILNNITWIKTSPPPNLSCRYFTHSTETILWIRKGEKSKHFFDYDLMKKKNHGKQMKDVWLIGRPKKVEKRFGKHPTQKPEELLERMILSSTREGDVILDMFNGSGTTGVVSVRNKRKYIGVELKNEYYSISKKRLTFECETL